MKILYDYQAFSWQKWGGVSNSFSQIIKNLPSEVKYQIAIKESDNVHLAESGICNAMPCRLTGDMFLTNRFFPGKYRLYRWFTKMFPHKTSAGENSLFAKELLRGQDFDIFHPTFFDSYFLRYLGSKPFVLTIHDMIPELMYENDNDPQIAAKQLLAPMASKIVAVSENTKRDIVRVLHIQEDKISVVYHGVPNITDYPRERRLDFSYVLFVGGRRQPYKNFIPMLKDMAPLLANKANLYLVCTGSPFTKEERLTLECLGIGNKVVHYFVANEAELMNLYHNAECFIFPSLYEGFGIPILEAYKAGCPVLLNRKSCFPEIAGDAAVYFTLDKYRDDFCQVLDEFLHWDRKEKDLLIQKQNRRMQLFTWEKSAQALTNIYREVLGKRHE